MKNKLVRGIGIYEKGLYQTKSKVYQVWDSMLHRCTSAVYQTRCASYIGCEVHPDFIKFQDFAAWCQNQIGFYIAGFELDKDILSPENKVYAPGNCVFVPKQINVMLTHNQRNRGLCPTGVCLYKPTGKYKAAMKLNGKTKNLGYYDTPEAAHEAYKAAKLNEIHRQATIYKDVIDPRAYAALMAYSFE